MTDISGKEVVRMPCIYYQVWFLEEQIRDLLYSGSKINVMNSIFARKLGFNIQKTNVGAQKIDGSTLETFRKVIADFQVEDKGNKPRFF